MPSGLPGLVVTVDDPTAESSYGGLGGHATYRVLTKHPDLGETTVRHRYSEFRSLRKSLLEACPGVLLPLIPEKKILANSSMLLHDADFLARRAAELAEFLSQVTSHQLCMASAELSNFLRWPQPLVVLVQEHAAAQELPPLERADGVDGADPLASSEGDLVAERDDLEAARIVLQRLASRQKDSATDTLLFGKLCQELSSHGHVAGLRAPLRSAADGTGAVAAALQAQAEANAVSGLLLRLGRFARLAGSALEQVALRRKLAERASSTAKRLADVSAKEGRETKDSKRDRLGEEARRLSILLQELRDAHAAFTRTLLWELGRFRAAKEDGLYCALRSFSAANEAHSQRVAAAWAATAAGVAGAGGGVGGGGGPGEERE